MIYLTDLISKWTNSLEWMMLVMVIGGGLFLISYAKFKPYFYFKHALQIVAGKFDKTEDVGQVSHFQALSAVIAATVGLGNISGVAVAIYSGGPGVVFWMWVTAFIGMGIKFYSCTLAVLLREVDENGIVRAGPMYYMSKGLGKIGKPLAIFFASVTLLGVLPVFTANQLTQSLIEVLQPNTFWAIGDFNWKLLLGSLLIVITATIIFGGLKKIVRVTSALVPFMVVIYLLAALFILATNGTKILPTFQLIFTEAFNWETSVIGGLSGLIIIGMRRAVFSNESGLGTAPIYHGQSKTNEPVQEGLVAMLGPFIDTIIVCTITALLILISGVYLEGDKNGIVLTMAAFDQLLFGFGKPLLLILVMVFALSTLFTYSFYGTQCLTYLGGIKIGKYYNPIYLLSIIFAAIASLEFVIGLIDLAFALMSISNMIALVLLAPKVKEATYHYFKNQYGKS
ncbi:MAG: alanine/glycine:cation symporter family protein [Flavobacterium sp.]|nr:alanine/glycine:cation symporter family protein [Flavobacterium sp.]